MAAPDEVLIHLDRSTLAQALEVSEAMSVGALDLHVLTVPASVRRAGQSKVLVIGDQPEPRIDHSLVARLHEAFRARRMVLDVGNESMKQMSKRLGMPNGHLTTLMRLCYLAPGIIRDNLDGHQPPGLTRQRLLHKSRELPHNWAEQPAWLGWQD